MKYLQLLLMSWIFLPSTFTHRDGVRVTQYEPLPRVAAPDGPVYSRGYRYRHTYLGGRGSWEHDYQIDRWSKVSQ